MPVDPARLARVLVSFDSRAEDLPTLAAKLNCTVGQWWGVVCAQLEYLQVAPAAVQQQFAVAYAAARLALLVRDPGQPLAARDEEADDATLVVPAPRSSGARVVDEVTCELSSSLQSALPFISGAPSLYDPLDGTALLPVPAGPGVILPFRSAPPSAPVFGMPPSPALPADPLEGTTILPTFPFSRR